MKISIFRSLHVLFAEISRHRRIPYLKVTEVVVYLIPMCTLQVRMSKIHFSKDSQVHEVQVRKASLHPLSQSNGSKISTWPDRFIAWKECPKSFVYVPDRLL